MKTDTDSLGRVSLLQWIADRGLSQAKFAALSGVSASDLSRYLTDDAARRTKPGPLNLERIELATSGVVGWRLWLHPAPCPAAPAGPVTADVASTGT